MIKRHLIGAAESRRPPDAGQYELASLRIANNRSVATTPSRPIVFCYYPSPDRRWQHDRSNRPQRKTHRNRSAAQPAAASPNYPTSAIGRHSIEFPKSRADCLCSRSPKGRRPSYKIARIREKPRPAQRSKEPFPFPKCRPTPSASLTRAFASVGCSGGDRFLGDKLDQRYRGNSYGRRL
jgi:hypothetical protein